MKTNTYGIVNRGLGINIIKYLQRSEQSLDYLSDDLILCLINFSYILFEYTKAYVIVFKNYEDLKYGQPKYTYRLWMDTCL